MESPAGRWLSPGHPSHAAAQEAFSDFVALLIRVELRMAEYWRRVA
jgi:hypothetical protein